MTDRSGVGPIPEGYPTVTPHLHVRGAADPPGFYRQALGAEEVYRMAAPHGTIMHAEMRIGDSHFMLSEEMEDWGNLSPSTLEGTSCRPHGCAHETPRGVRAFHEVEATGIPIRFPLPGPVEWRGAMQTPARPNVSHNDTSEAPHGCRT